METRGDDDDHAGTPTRRGSGLWLPKPRARGLSLGDFLQTIIAAHAEAMEPMKFAPRKFSPRRRIGPRDRPAFRHRIGSARSWPGSNAPRELVSMIAVDTNVLVGAIQTFDPQLHETARHAVKFYSVRVSNSSAFHRTLSNFGMSRPGRLGSMVSASLLSRQLDTWTAFRACCCSYPRRQRYFRLGESSCSNTGSPEFRSTMPESLRR